MPLKPKRKTKQKPAASKLWGVPIHKRKPPFTEDDLIANFAAGAMPENPDWAMAITINKNMQKKAKPLCR